MSARKPALCATTVAKTAIAGTGSVEAKESGAGWPKMGVRVVG